MKDKWIVNDTGLALLIIGSITVVLTAMNFGKNLVEETIKHVKRKQKLKTLKQTTILMDEILTNYEEHSKKK